MEELCIRPFSQIEIYAEGDVYVCCPDWTRNYCIGNVFKKDGTPIESFDEIWYSERAIKLRKSLLDNSYKYCDNEVCFKQLVPNIDEDVQYTLRPDYPSFVRLNYDRQCNLKCMICRDSYCVDSENENKKFDDIMDSILIPMMRNANIVSLAGIGEVTASKHSKNLIKKIAEKYPNVKFHITTNGLLFNEKFCSELGILDKLFGVVVSVHGMTKQTYETIMRGSNFEIVMKNLQWLSGLKQENKIIDFTIIFCISSINYKEIPLMAKYAQENGINVRMWDYRKYDVNIEMSKNYKKYAVWEKTHPEYNKFAKIISDVKLKYKDCEFPQHIVDLKPISIWESFIYSISRIFRIKL